MSEDEDEDYAADDDDDTIAQMAMDLEMVSVADQIREKGNAYFKAGEYDASEAEYTRSIEHLQALQTTYEEVPCPEAFSTSVTKVPIVSSDGFSSSGPQTEEAFACTLSLESRGLQHQAPGIRTGRPLFTWHEGRPTLS